LLIFKHELENGVPLSLSQLSETLRLQTTDAPFPSGAIGDTAKKHGGELLKRGFNVSQVVHHYGDICQAITQTAVEQNVPVTVDEFNTLNRCLDDAIAEAVTEHARITADLFEVSGDRRGRDRSGLGLGLSIARQVGRAHSGDIRVRNMPGKGCVFTIDLPLAAEEVNVRQSI
jgi:Histidine kinase-, DNA gyrase B-, and HSP90-like ATPase